MRIEEHRICPLHFRLRNENGKDRRGDQLAQAACPEGRKQVFRSHSHDPVCALLDAADHGKVQNGVAEVLSISQ